MIDRKTALEELIDLKIPLNIAIHQIGMFEWDSEEELVLMGRRHIVKILQDFIQGKLSKKEILSWANAVEGRDDIGIDVEVNDIVSDAIFTLANPEISEDLTKETALKIIHRFSE